MSNNIICLCVLLIFLSSCTHRFSHQKGYFPVKNRPFMHKQFQPTAVEQAKLCDVAIHPHAEHIPLLFYKNSATTMLGYQHNSGPINTISQWYIEHMEQLGWHCRWSIEGFERTYLFEKPTKHCVISIRPFKRGCRAVISLSIECDDN